MMTTANGVAPVDYQLKLAAAGTSVLPVARGGGKGPAVDVAPTWKEFQRRIASPTEIQLWHRNGAKGSGIVCGRVSGGLEVIDWDDREPGDQGLERLELIAPELVDRITIHRTPKGYHWFIRSDYVQGNQKLAKDATGKKTLVETKGEGGYVVGPHSPLDCHPLREPYIHIAGPPVESVGKFTAEERETILRIGRSFNQYTKPQHEPPQQPQQRGEGLSPGDDFNQRATWQSILEPHGWQELYSGGWRRPGKTSGSISATTTCRSQSGKELLCVFSSNAEPLESETNYDKFGAYAHLNHGGDFAAAAKQLASEGYGDPPRRQGMPDWRPEEYRDEPEPESEPEPKVDFWQEWLESLRETDRLVAYDIVDGDNQLNRLKVRPQGLTVVGGLQGFGKTALVMQALVNILFLYGELRALVANVEMSPGDLLDRQLARFARVNSSLIQRRAYMGQTRNEVLAAAERLAELRGRLTFMAAPFTTKRLIAAAERDNADIVVCDYLQRFTPGDSADQRMRVSDCMSDLRKLAMSGPAVIALSAMSRAGEFRDSSEIEFGADFTYQLIKPEGAAENELLCKNLKNRFGPLEHIPLEFNGAYQEMLAPDEVAIFEEFAQYSGDFEY